MNKFLKHVNIIRIYLTYLVNIRNYIKKLIKRKKERVITKYNKEVRKT